MLTSISYERIFRSSESANREAQAMNASLRSATQNNKHSPRKRPLVQLLGAAAFSLLAPFALALDGAALFDAKCAMCHREAGMGTGLLQRRMDPAIAKLETRRDLTSEFVISAARIGIGNMPRIPRGEVSDQQMKAIAEYLSAKR